jgi:hypothetical protein
VSSVSHDHFIGDDPLADGMHIVIDFTVTDAGNLPEAGQSALCGDRKA